MPDAAKLIIQVTAGVIPGQPEEEYTRRYSLGSQEWEQCQAEGPMGVGAALAELNGRAMGYAGLLMLQPDRVNFVNVEWVYL